MEKNWGDTPSATLNDKENVFLMKNTEHGTSIRGLTLMVLLAFLRSFRSFSLSSIAFLCALIASSNEDFNFSTLVSCSNKTR